jgi:very-short-patch-repair endonuclease
MSHQEFLKEKSRELRKNSTPGEIKLWNRLLKGKKCFGYQFNRQYVVEGFIVDFICRRLKIIIEIDGYSHQFKVEKDEKRDTKLSEMGYQVLRFKESDVIQHFEQVVRAIEIIIEKTEKK